MIRRLVRPLPRNLVLKKLPTESHDTDGPKWIWAQHCQTLIAILVSRFAFFGVSFGKGAPMHTVEMPRSKKTRNTILG